MTVRNLRPLGLAVSVLVIIDAAWKPLILGWVRLSPSSFAADVTPIARGVDDANTIFSIAVMIVFACWIWLAGRNLVANGTEDLEFSPGSRVWWFFVPIASLFKPFQGMRELWNASRGSWPYDLNHILVSTWWAAWLMKNYVAYFLAIAVADHGGAQTTLIITSVLDVAAAIPAVMIVNAISRAQSGLDHTALTEVFA